MTGERLRGMADREPIVRKITDKVGDRSNKLRNRVGKNARERLPRFGNRNIGEGTVIGTIEAGVATLLKDTVGIPFGSEVEIADISKSQGGTVYTVNVNAPFEDMAKMQAFFEANTGFTSLLTNKLNVESVDVLNTRLARDTYQIDILVER